MHKGNEDYPVWSEPTECLQWHKSEIVMGRICHNNTLHRTLPHIGLHSRRPIKVHIQTLSTVERAYNGHASDRIRGIGVTNRL